MKLHDRRGNAQFFVVDENTGESMLVNESDYLTRRQATRMKTRPDMILQFAHHLAKVHPATEPRRVRVHALVSMALNHRPPRLLIDPQVNLAAVPRSLGPAPWILPLEESWPGTDLGDQSIESEKQSRASN